MREKITSGVISPATAAWLWVPTLYFMEGVPNSIVDQVAPIFLKDIGLENALIATLVATAYLPWVFKPLWGPLIDLHRTKRWWVPNLQAAGAIGIFLLAGAIYFFPNPALLLAALLLVSVTSATHDIAADGFYMHGLNDAQQSYFVGIRNTAYRIAAIFCQGAIVGGVGLFVSRGAPSVPFAWSAVLSVLAAILLALALYHKKVFPFPESDAPARIERGKFWREFIETWLAFFTQKNIGILVAFLLLFRLAEVQLVRMSVLFLKDGIADGGLALSNENLGLLNGTFGTIALLGGGILGGILVSKNGLKKWIWPMVFVMHIPNIAFVALAHFQPSELSRIGVALTLEKFGYGFGFAAYSIVMLRFANGVRRTAHFAIMTGFMALGSVIPGYWIGAIQKNFGYENFFWWVMLCTIPGFIVTFLITRKLEK